MLLSGELKSRIYMHKSAMQVNSLPNYKTVHKSFADKFRLFRLRASVDDKLWQTQMIRFVFYRVETILVKGENGGFPAFSPPPKVFVKDFIPKNEFFSCCYIEYKHLENYRNIIFHLYPLSHNLEF